MSDRHKRERVSSLDVTGELLVKGVAVLDGAPFDRMKKIARIPLVASDAAGGVVSWVNPEGVDILIVRAYVNVTTVATAACTIDIGTTATSAATSSDNLIDGLDVNAAAGLFDNITDKGTNGKSRQRLASGKWVTASVASGASAGIVGFLFLEYVMP